MNIIFLLAPFSVALGLMAVGAFFWTLRSGQYEDIQGAAARILIDDDDPDMPTSEAPLTALEPDENLPG
ncbi:MAG: cbb3-type cytochrome oxidase assembly protein CcoS [Alphaproteobacteria bacterium]|uniref:cbb3-type cytochrome oxidase assembly protein CcoS n=1 Tax=Brevundimonas sp. TaxID=1871086 RepID=UPI0017CE9A8A|nr:cbb3-type cytochrome oxidase assembly protein CcoS [Brevundimonas sp.]MBU3970012.1 cbb3-type cytochrome oxidase assembly protein CcoS [Alphaproteobacteria bacterium]MBA3048903.1 cbb3-type cytochrome oxidase assembly protein CcoS [Brevundimonas sp.]MBU3972902.1 cbb3-type cytochrome oxidase assembly protein CcoS [Alphaproteobacteria bacterium]MBU4038303.1 cbb3-type cytochrome oxidase assembly protein CcoS [Alphaproteobacteria bacterium]MBU4137659.1 cbb3-type cytochrome oxidase assembly protei